MGRPRISRCSWIAVLALLCAPVAAADNAAPNAPAVKNSDAQVPTKPHDSAASPQSVVPPAASEEPSSVGPATTLPASETPGVQDREGPAAEAGGQAPDGQAPGLPVSAPEADRRVEAFALQQPVASQVAEVLNDVFRAGGRGTVLLRITANVNSNSIVALGTVEELNEIRDILKLLDVPQLGPGDASLPLATYDLAGDSKDPARPAAGLPTAPPPTVKQLAVYRLRYAAASHAMAVLSQVFGGDRGSDTLKLQANVVNNSIIAIGNVEKIREVAALLNLLDISQPGRAGTAVDPKAEPALPRPSVTELKIFSLKNSQATAALSVIRALYDAEGGGPSRIAVDERTNSLIARGSPESVREIEALLLKLETVESMRAGAASKGPYRSAGPAEAQLPGDPAILDRLATDRFQQYRELERQVSRLAEETHKLQEGPPGTLSANPSRLRETVYAAFEARQELQRVELAQLRQRLARIEEDIETRQRIKDAIVEHRVKELLEPGLQWTPPGEEAATIAEPAETRFGSSRANPIVAQEKNAPAAWKAAAEVVDPFAAPNASDGVRLIDSPHAFQEKLAEAFARQRRVESETSALLEQVRKSNPAATLEEIKTGAGALREQLEAANKAVDFLRNEYATQIRLLELDVLHAEQEFATADSVLPMVRGRFDSGRATASEVIEKENAVRGLKVRVDQRKAILELYRKIPDVQIETPKAEPLKPVEKAEATDNAAGERVARESFGLELRPVGRESLAKSSYSGGLLIVASREGSPAARANLRVGDILVGLEQWETTSLASVAYVISRVSNYSGTYSREQPGKPVRFLILRGAELRSGVMQIQISGDAPGPRSDAKQPSPTK